MLGQSQGRGCASSESRFPALNVHTAPLACVAADRRGGGGAAAEPRRASSCTSLFDACPMCAKDPVEPIRIEGQWACRSCTAGCSICGSPCVPGDDACSECVRHLNAAEAIPA